MLPRDFSKVSSKFWTGETGKALRAQGQQSMLTALYLMTAPASNMLGLYYLPILYLAAETGSPFEGASKALQRVVETGFCKYDFEAEVVWVVEVASHELGSPLNANDLRCKGVMKLYASLPKCLFLGDFFDRYHKDFHLTERRENTSPLQAPSKPLRSLETYKEKKEPPVLRTSPPFALDKKLALVGPPRPAKATSDLSVAELVDAGVNPQVAQDWLRVRGPRAPLTATAWATLKREAAAANLTPAQAVEIAAGNSWRGFKASWLRDGKPARNVASTDPFEAAR
jgi:hypothetical protein